MAIYQANGQDFAQWRTVTQRLDFIFGKIITFMPLPDLGNQMWRIDFLTLQGPETFNYDGKSQNRTQKNRQHYQAASLYHFKHRGFSFLYIESFILSDYSIK